MLLPEQSMKRKTSEPSVLYARVSSKEQAEEGFSIPAQRQLLRGYAQREGLQIIIEFSDGESATHRRTLRGSSNRRVQPARHRETRTENRAARPTRQKHRTQQHRHPPRQPRLHRHLPLGREDLRGKYEPLITRALFDEVQDVLAGRTRPCARKYTFTYTVMITCKTCNGLLVGDRKKGKYTYCACNKCRTYYPEAFFDQHTATTLERIAIDEDMTDFLLHQLGDWYDETTSTQTTSTERLRKRITELQRLKAASYEEKLLGRLTENAWQAHNERWQQELDELEHALAASAPTLKRDEFLAAAHRPIELAQTAARQYLTQNATEKREVLRALLSNCTMSDGTLTVTMRSRLRRTGEPEGK
jgi:hypothetical protein